MRKILVLCLGVLLFNGALFAQSFTDLSQEVPFDKTFRKGVLPNGLTYYIKHNEEPKGRASYYIYQNVGAVLETDKQDGLAHFLEHMAFNGTKTFPKKSMLNMLESNGIKFGRDINAYTTHNETVYNISRVPTADKNLVDSCLIILRDWCDELSLEVEEIDAERGVINEEWRSRISARTRLSEQVDAVKYNNSIYSKRTVIGDMDVVKTFDPKELRDFYHNWYRTDLQAIAVIGDIDVDAVEKRIKELFSPIPAIENPKERFFAEIADNAEPLYTIGTDKELKNESVSLMIRNRTSYDNTLGGLREKFVNSFFNALMSNRYKEITSKGNAPFLRGSANYGDFMRGYKVFTISTQAKKGELSNAFEATYRELQRVINHGFTKNELERLKTNMLLATENKYIKKESINSESYGKALKATYLSGASIPDAKFNYNFAKAIIPTITLEEVQAYASKFLTDHNRIFVVNAPEGRESTLPNLEKLEAIITKVQKENIAPYVDNTPISTKLLSKEPKGGKIINEKKLTDFNAVEWKLSNGATVVYRFADYEKNNVALSAVSDGGASVYEVKDLPSYGGAAQYVKSFGIGDLSPSTYKKVMTGKSANSSFRIGNYSESVSGASTTKDIETMMQLVYMRFEEPRFDKEKFDIFIKKGREALKNQVKTAKSVMKDTLNSIIFNNDPRYSKFDTDYLNQIDFNKIKEIYTDRFDGASDFTFFIVGDVSEEKIKPLVEKYIGSIKETTRKENWVSNKSYYPHGKHEYQIQLPMDEPKATVAIKMRADAKYSRENVIYHSILSSILNLRYTENIREKEGGTYGVGVRANSSRIPNMEQTLNIQFSCDPEKAEHLKSLVYKELEIIQKKVTQEELDKVILNIKKNTEHRTESNKFWMSALKTYYETGEDKQKPEYLETILNNITPKDIQKHAKKFLKKTDVLDIVFSSGKQNP
ncbi:M16 family metallopeptidase [Tenacibaculum aestuarii]|uniref:M16 family metallopeptidase n=1 Tax=Tenacibaculum aestuarii TaxID=362781 RepID=UPI0038962FFB